MDTTTLFAGILLLVLICLYLIIVYKKLGRTAALLAARKVAYQLFLQAEKQFGTNNGTGAIKMDWAAERIVEAVPIWARYVVTELSVRLFLDTAYAKSRDYLDDGIINNE